MISAEEELDLLVGKVTGQLEAAKQALEEEYENLINELGLKLEEADRSEDSESDSKLIPLDLAVAALYRVRDETLDDYVPTWGQLASGQIQQRLNLWMNAMGSVFAALNTFDLRPLRDVFREWLVLTSPKGLIVAVGRARDKTIAALTKDALRPKSERRRWKRISSRNPRSR